MPVKIVDDKTDQYAKRIAQAAERLLKQAAFGVEAGAKMRAPVDTGHLRNSIQTRFPVPGMAVISANANYAIYVEMGTRYMAAQPFLIPAFDHVKSKFAQQLKNLRSEAQL